MKTIAPCDEIVAFPYSGIPKERQEKGRFASSGIGVDGHWKAVPRMQGVVGPAKRLASDLDAFYPPGLCSQHDFRLHAGDRLPDAAVDAHTEADVARGVSPDVEALRVAPAPGVAVGGPEEQQHLLPSPDA